MSLIYVICCVLFSCIASQEYGDWKENLETVENEDKVFFEGDMILPRRTVEQAVDGKEIQRSDDSTSKEEGTDGVMSAITAPLAWRWKGGVVPYVINETLTCSGILCLIGGASKVIAAAMEEWSTKTCITFRQKTDKDKDYVHFQDSKWGHCAAHIGRLGGEQFVYLGKFCRSKGIVLHEIGHALGLFHEQSRPDRDQYIKIIWENIKEKHWYNFKAYKTGISDMKTPYDYDSIMHYGAKAFKKWYTFSDTIQQLKSGKRIGQREYLSDIDVEEVNTYYDCQEKH